MTIFCDTNIIMEFLQQRKYSEEVSRILTNATQAYDELFISVGSFYTITYLSEKYLKTDEALTKKERVDRLREILNSILTTFKFADLNTSSVKDGVNDHAFSDLEDSYQAHVAEDCGCEVLLTINKQHFVDFAKSSQIKVLTPVEFIDQYL